MKARSFMLAAFTSPLILGFISICLSELSQAISSSFFPKVLHNLISNFFIVLPRGTIPLCLEAITFYLGSSFVFGGIQYFVFIIFVWITLRHASDKKLNQFSFIAPIAFYPFLLAGLLIMSFEDESAWMFALLAVPFGYFYVILFLGLLKLFQKFSWVKPFAIE